MFSDYSAVLRLSIKVIKSFYQLKNLQYENV